MPTPCTPRVPSRLTTGRLSWLTPLVLFGLGFLPVAATAQDVDQEPPRPAPRAPAPTPSRLDRQRVGAQTELAIDPASVRRFGTGWAHPRDGWWIVHIEGTPHARGFQHGQLLAAEIVAYITVMAKARSHADHRTGWDEARRLVDALFLRQYSRECREEMQGIADGASAAGARWHGRRLDLLDVAIINSGGELAYLDEGLVASPRGLERERFEHRGYSHPKPRHHDHCSAFAAIPPAAPPGELVLGHITMSNIAEVPHFNIWLDIQPAEGERLVFQTCPGGIQSGLDYYLNGAGLVIAETTIQQTRFEPTGQALASRIRHAVQYARSIDQAVDLLSERGNGLYTNQWLLADINSGEIALFELGTTATHLWRSSRNEWIGDTPGFYWGCNTSRSPRVLRETTPDLAGRPANLVIHPGQRDRAWFDLYQQRRGFLNEAFGFEAFTRPPIAAFSSCDAKFTTRELARRLQSWGLFGPPIGPAWVPAPHELEEYPHAKPLVPNDWTLLDVTPPPAAPVLANEPIPPSPPATDLKGKPAVADRPGTDPGDAGRNDAVTDDARPDDAEPDDTSPVVRPAISRILTVDAKPFHDPDDESEPTIAWDARHPPLWRGTLLAATPADLWLATAFADYQQIVALEDAQQRAARELDQPRSRADRELAALTLAEPLARWRHAQRRLGQDVPLHRLQPHVAHNEWYDIASGKGVWILHRLRQRVGLDRLAPVLDQFGSQHAGTAVTTTQFLEHLREHLDAAAAEAVREDWQSVTPQPAVTEGWHLFSFEAEIDRSLIVYGTRRDRAALRETALRLQREVARRFTNHSVPVLADTELTPEQLRSHHLLLVGRPATLAVDPRLFSALPAQFEAASFRLGSERYVQPATAVACAGGNPLAPRYSVVLFAGLSADATWRLVEFVDADEDPPAPIVVLPARGQPQKRAGVQ